MAKFRLGANAEIDVLTKAELDESLKNPGLASDVWTARGRAEKYLEAVLQFPGGVLPSIGPNLAVVLNNDTPNSGYAWAIRNLGFQLGTASIPNVWKTADPAGTAASLVKPYGRGTSNTIQAFQFSSVQFVLKAGEYVALTTQASVTMGGPVFLAYMEVPEAELWKVE